jgi:hypothetical protein
MPVAEVAVLGTVVDDEDGGGWGSIQWQRQHSMVTAMDYR